MKTFSYEDPYDKLTFYCVVADEDAEFYEKTIQMLNDDKRQIDNLERKERNHTAYHFEGLVYEGMEYASDEDVESNVTRAEIEQMIDAWLRENLTVVQYERFKLFMDGMSIREIARQQGVDFSSVNESIKAAQKKLQKIWHDTPSKHPF